MKKLSFFVQWVVVLTLFTFIGYGLFRSKPEPSPTSGQLNNWKGFQVLAYEGLTDDPNPRYVSPQRFREHLLALQKAGFRTVTLDEVKAFYYQDRPLPHNALLLLFEGARSDHLIRATPVLQETGFRGNLAVATELPRQWGNHYLNAAQIRKLARLHHWELISMGNDSLQPIPIDDRKHQGHFLTNRKWNAGHQETLMAYEQRVTRDIATAAGKLSRWSGSVSEAFLFPYNDSGAARNRDLASAEILRNEVSLWHSLAFSSDGSPFNARNRDPLDLTRMRVKGTLSGEELVSLLKSFRPGASIQPELKTPVDEKDWITLGTPTTLSAAGLTIPADSRIFLKGSGVWPHQEWSGLIKRQPDTDLHLYLRYGGPQRFLRLRWSQDQLWVQEKNSGPLHNLFSAPLPVAPESMLIRVQLRNNRLRLLDAEGQSLFSSVPVSVKGPGSLMLEAVNGSVLLEKWAFAPITDHYRMLGSLDEIPEVNPDAQTHIFYPLPSKLEELAPYLPQLASLASSGVQLIAVWPGSVNATEVPELWNQLNTFRDEHPALVGFLRNIALECPPVALLTSKGLADNVYCLIPNPEQALANLDLSHPGLQHVVMVFTTVKEDADSMLKQSIYQRPPERMVFRAETVQPSWPAEVGVLHISSPTEKENAHETL